MAGPVATDDEPAEDEGDADTPDLADLTERLAIWCSRTKPPSLTPVALATSIPAAPATAQLVNALVLFAAGTTKYSRRTLQDLDTLARWRDEQLARTALAPLFLPDPPAQADQAEVPALPPLALNEDQFTATRAALNARLTVITGPPGTGKSQVVAAIMASAALCGRSALLASKNHKALDAVEERLQALLPEDRTILARASRPWGTGQTFDLRTATDALLSRGAATGQRNRLQQDAQRLARTQRRLDELEERLQAQADLGETLAAAEARLEDAADALPRTRPC